MEDEERDIGEGVVIEDAELKIESVIKMRPANDVHFARQEIRWVPISLPRVKWLERAEA
jgi:hypothetical protein